MFPSCVSRWKFRDRVVLIGVGVTFTVLLIIETTFLNTITPLAQKTNVILQQDNVDSENKPQSERAAIFEGILQNLDSHLGVMRKELAVIDDEGLSDRLASHAESEGHNSGIKEAITHSRVVQKYADTFIKIADILSKSHGANVGVEADGGGKATAASGTAAGVSGKKGISSAWPELGVYSGNTSISNRVHPNGYMKREGTDFQLDHNVTQTLVRVAEALAAKHRKHNSSQWETLNVYKPSRHLQAYKRWHNAINRYQLYPDDPIIVKDVLQDLRTLTPDEIYEKPDSGTQFKLFFHFENHARALFKAIRYNRDQETLPDHYYFSDFERFNAEIAAFHLDRLLGFHRVPPATGRIFHIKDEIEQYAVEGLEDEIFYSPAGNLCIRGRCDYYCDLHHMVCGRPYLLEGVLMAYLPSQNDVERISWKHPWRRSYIVLESAKWEDNPKYCAKVRQTHPYTSGRRLLDLMDLSIFDFLIGNMDRHHYETIRDFGNDTFILAYDNGKGFGSSKEDEMTCLYPVMHCCLIRYTTFQKLLDFQQGPVFLSSAMRQSLQDDPVTPVLAEAHLQALDRRVKIILREIYQCTSKLGYSNVIVDDGF